MDASLSTWPIQENLTRRLCQEKIEDNDHSADGHIVLIYESIWSLQVRNELDPSDTIFKEFLLAPDVFIRLIRRKLLLQRMTDTSITKHKIKLQAMVALHFRTCSQYFPTGMTSWVSHSSAIWCWKMEEIFLEFSQALLNISIIFQSDLRMYGSLLDRSALMLGVGLFNGDLMWLQTVQCDSRFTIQPTHGRFLVLHTCLITWNCKLKCPHAPSRRLTTSPSLDLLL